MSGRLQADTTEKTPLNFTSWLLYQRVRSVTPKQVQAPLSVTHFSWQRMAAGRSPLSWGWREGTGSMGGGKTKKKYTQITTGKSIHLPQSRKKKPTTVHFYYYCIVALVGVKTGAAGSRQPMLQVFFSCPHHL